MANSPIVTSLPQYVDENKIGLVSKSVLGAKTASMINLQTGIKDAATVNISDYDVQFGDGSDCGWDEAGSVTLSQRKIQTGQIKINMAFCDKKLLGKYAQHQVKIAAGTKTLPFEQEFTEGIVDDVKAKNEKALWMGDTDSEDANLNKYDGFVKIIDAAEGVKSATIASGATKVEAIKAMNKEIPAELRDKGDVVIFVGADFFADYIQEMVDANLYHYSADNADGEYKIPAFNIRVIAVNGLNGSNRLFAGRLSNFYVGCDLDGDEEKFDLWYSKDNREFRLDIEYNLGVQVGIPSEIVKGTLS